MSMSARLPVRGCGGGQLRGVDAQDFEDSELIRRSARFSRTAATSSSTVPNTIFSMTRILAGGPDA